MFLRNVGKHLLDYTASHSKRQYTSHLSLCESQTLHMLSICTFVILHQMVFMLFYWRQKSSVSEPIISKITTSETIMTFLTI